MRKDNEGVGVEALEKQLTRRVEQGLVRAGTGLDSGVVRGWLGRTVAVRLIGMGRGKVCPILLVLSSPGGHVESGDMIHDMIKFIKPRVRVLGTGWVASAGALIYVAAESWLNNASTHETYGKVLSHLTKWIPPGFPGEKATR